MTTEPKAEGGEAVGFVSAQSLRALLECRNDVHNGCTDIWLRPENESDVPVYLHPTPSAVEALARAAEAVYVDSNNEDLWNALEAALAHPEIAALLETK